jgi:hypothetical protein
MMAKLTALVNVLRTYPAISAALVNFGVIAAAHFGIHATGAQLVADVGALDVLFGIIVHSNVVPLAKVAKPAVGSAVSDAGEPVPVVAPVDAPAPAASAEPPTTTPAAS